MGRRRVARSHCRGSGFEPSRVVIYVVAFVPQSIAGPYF